MKQKLLINFRMSRVAGVLGVLLLTGCRCLSLNQLTDYANTPRVAERCTSISNIIGKNYRVSAQVNLFGHGGGVGWSQTGVQLSNEAAERQIEIDRLCRAWAVGAITDDKWSDTYIQYVLASVTPLIRNNSPEAVNQLNEAKEKLTAATKELAKVRNGGEYDPDAAASKLSDEIAKAKKSNETLEDIHRKLDKLYGETGLPLAGHDHPPSPTEISDKQIDLIRSEMGGQQRELLQVLGLLKGQIEKLKGQIEKVEGKIDSSTAASAERSWREKFAVKIHFDNGSSYLTDAAKKLLNQLFSGQYSSDIRVEIIGYTDVSGNAKKNSALSVARAQEVRDFIIISRNVPASAVVSLGHQRGVTFFGSPEENRVATIRVFEIASARPTTLPD